MGKGNEWRWFWRKIDNVLAVHGAFNRLNDVKYLKRRYKASLGSLLDLEHPRGFNEKLQWLKLYDRQPIYVTMVDKVAVKDYVAKIVGERYIIPTIGVWGNPNEIDFQSLPEQFVLKCNHNSGLGMYICRDKNQKNIHKVKKELKRGLREDYYLAGREWPYKDVPRKIIAEQYMQSDDGGLTDYKIHCFNGVPKFVLVCKDRFAESGLTEDFFSPQWEHLDIRRPKHPNSLQPIPQPEALSEMLYLAQTLSKDVPFLRVDFYVINQKVYFSELTFFPASGFEKYEPTEWDEIFGSWLSLPNK